MARFAAKLMFQLRFKERSLDSRIRTCEERFINFTSRSSRSALAYAKRRGKASEFSYANADGQEIFFDFIGIMVLLKLGAECTEEEVWYEIKGRVLPMERRQKWIPTDQKLLDQASFACVHKGAA